MDDNLKQDNKDNFDESFYTDNGIYYTIDKFIDKLDHNEIYEKIEQKYDFMNSNITRYVQKKIFMDFISDTEFVASILTYYNLSIQELFKILIKKYDNLLRGKLLEDIRKYLSYGVYRMWD